MRPVFNLCKSAVALLIATLLVTTVHSFQTPHSSAVQRTIRISVTELCGKNSNDHKRGTRGFLGRRYLLKTIFSGSIGSAFLLPPVPAIAEGGIPDTLDVDNFLKYGQVANPMGVSGQAGKSRPETGVVLSDGVEVARDSRSGGVFAEILVGPRNDPQPVLASFFSPWPLATGTVFDVECRNAKTGDGAFLSVSGNTKGKSLSNLPDSFFLDSLFQATGRFSFYGSPTNVKVKNTSMSDDGRYRYMELTFSNLSQSTQTEIPRRALVAATIPEGTDNAVMLVGSASTSRWKKGGAEGDVRATVESFRAIPAPKSNRKLRPMDRTKTNAA